MKKIVFLLALSAVNFLEITPAMETQQQKLQNRPKISKSIILEKLKMQGVSADETLSYEELLSSSEYKQKITERMKELEGQFRPKIESIRTEQIERENKDFAQLKKIIGGQIEKSLKLLEGESANMVFDKLQSVLPLSKYEELEPLLIKVIALKNCKKTVSGVITALKKLQSEDMSDVSDLFTPRSNFRADRIIKQFKKHGGLGADAELNDLVNSSGTKSFLLSGVIDGFADEDRKQKCADALDRLRNLNEAVYYQNSSVMEIRRKDDPLEALEYFYRNAAHRIENKLRRLEYRDTDDSFPELFMEAGLNAAKLYSSREQSSLQKIFNEKKIAQSAPFGRESPYSLFVLGEELAKLLEYAASRSDFGEAFFGDYDSYCEKMDMMDKSRPGNSDFHIRRQNALPMRTEAKSIPAPNIYKSVEECIRFCFSFEEKEERLLLIKNVRIFLRALRDIVHSPDASAKKTAVKKALAVLEVFNQAESPLKEETKDIALVLNEEQLKDIEELKKTALPMIKDFKEKLDRLKDVSSIDYFIKKLDGIVETAKHRFLEENKESFDFCCRQLAKYDKMLDAECSKNMKTLHAELADIQEQLSEMNFADLHASLYNKRFDLRFSLSEAIIEYWKRRGLTEFPINRWKNADSVIEEIQKNSKTDEEAEYLCGLIKTRMSLINQLKQMIPALPEMHSAQIVQIDQVDENLINKCIAATEKTAEQYPGLRLRRLEQLRELAPIVKEFGICRIISKLMSGTAGSALVLFDFNTPDGCFDTKITYDGDKIKDVEYGSEPSAKSKLIPASLYEFFAAADSDPKNAEHFISMMENFSPELLNRVNFGNGKLPQWAVISNRLLNIRRKEIEDKEKHRALCALAVVSDDMNTEQIMEHLAKYVKDPLKELTSMTREDFIWNDGFVRDSCVPERIRLLRLFGGKAGSELQRDLLLTDNELAAEFSKYALEKKISAPGLYLKLSEGNRYETEKEVYLINVFLRTLEAVFDREDNCYISQTDIQFKDSTDTGNPNIQNRNVKPESLICGALDDDIKNKKDSIKFFITDVEEAGVPLKMTVLKSLEIISSPSSLNFTDIESIIYLFRTLEKKVDKYRAVQAENRKAGDAADEKKRKEEADIKIELLGLMGTLIQGLSHCPDGRSLAVHHIINDMLKEDKNMSKVSLEEALKYSIQTCSAYYFDSIFHFSSVPETDQFLRAVRNRHVFKVSGLEIKGIDLKKTGLDSEEIMMRSRVLSILGGDYGLSQTAGTPKISALGLCKLHMYILEQAGKRNMTVLQVMKNLYSSRDEAIRKYGADYSSGEIGENFYAWAYPIEINGQTAELHIPEQDDCWLNADQEKLIRALIDEPMHNIDNITAYITGENCSFIWSVIVSKLKAECSGIEEALATKEKKMDAGDKSGSEYENYLNKRVMFYALKKFNLLKAKS